MPWGAAYTGQLSRLVVHSPSMTEPAGHTVVAGGAGFVGSHLVDALVARGERVTVIDNLSTGCVENIAHLAGHPLVRFIEHDVCEALPELQGITAVANLACPASPKDFDSKGFEILAVGSVGNTNLLELAHCHHARFLVTSTSEVYGEPAVHPQSESYFGNVDPTGPRSVYDESKRFAEASTSAYRRLRGTNTAIARLFNTYGPRMRLDDGRAVVNMVVQALRGEPLTVYGDGQQTRSFCFVSDTVSGLLALLDSTHPGPVNLGNPAEVTILHLARLTVELTDSGSSIAFLPPAPADPTRRRPDISVAQAVLGWCPEVPLVDGLQSTIDSVRAALAT